jgi:hypothetical protein
MKKFMLAVLMTCVMIAVTSTVFAAVVSGPTTTTKTLQWDPVTKNTDGTTITDLAGYNAYMTSSSTGTVYTKLGSTAANVTSYTDQITIPGNVTVTRCWVVTAFDTSGNESANSNIICKSFFGLDTIPPIAPTNLR